MPASFPVGLRSAGKDTRVVLAAGSQRLLRRRILDVALADTATEVHYCNGADDDLWVELFSYPDRPSQQRLVVVRNAELADWSPLAEWLTKAKPNRLVAETHSYRLGLKLGEVIKTRGVVIDCNNPERTQRNAFVKVVSEWYGQPTLTVNSILTSCDWVLDEALGAMDKMALVGLESNLKALKFFGTPTLDSGRYLRALVNDKHMDALALARGIRATEVPAVLDLVEAELHLLSRISVMAAKTTSEIATILGCETAAVREREKVAARYSLKKIAKDSLALAHVDRLCAQGVREGLLELLVHLW